MISAAGATAVSKFLSASVSSEREESLREAGALLVAACA